LVKQFGRGNSKVQFSKETNNLTNVHSYKHSGKFVLLFTRFFVSERNDILAIWEQMITLHLWLVDLVE